MLSLTNVLRARALSIVLPLVIGLCALPCARALAAPGDLLILTTATADTQNVLEAIQQASGEATQDLRATLSATTDVVNTQTFTPEVVVQITQECPSGDSVCIQHAAASLTVSAIQAVTASASDLLTVSQQAVSGDQSVTLTGSALTSVIAEQTLAPRIVLDVSQDCATGLGACVQSALPVISVLAQQIIDASATNVVDVTQEMTSGDSQNADITVEASTEVLARQIVTPTALVTLVQTCKVNTGLCIQSARSLMEVLAEQVVHAQSTNEISLEQTGATNQEAVVASGTHTVIEGLQEVLASTTIVVEQQCDVTQGLCIQSYNGRQTFVFTDGETVETGDYVGVLDEHALDETFDRTTVAMVAMGTCPSGEGSCPRVQRLIDWLFGPEPSLPAPSAPSADRQGHSMKRGHETNVMNGIIRFAASRNRQGYLPSPAFGGGDAVLDEYALSVVCSVRSRIADAEDRDALSAWAATEIADATGADEAAVAGALEDASMCPEAEILVKAPRTIQLVAFPIDEQGPVSSNDLWNACIRGEYVSYPDILSNQDRDPHTNRPRSCGDYHMKDEWTHPDLGIRFTWDPTKNLLVLPSGYLAMTLDREIAMAP